MLNYNQNGRSLGVANIIFSKPETAAKAAKDLNGLLVDGRPMKVRLVFIYFNLFISRTPSPGKKFFTFAPPFLSFFVLLHSK